MRPVLRALGKPSRRWTLPAGHQWARWQQSRHLSGTSRRREEQGPDEQSEGFTGYVADMLDAPLHKVQPATRTQPEPSPPENLPMTTREETLAKARLVFGSRLAGPEERQKELESKSQMIAGVLVPPKPEEPDNCCMSGCVNCVWELYRVEMEEYLAKRNEANQKMMDQRTTGQATGMMAQEAGTPSHVAISMDDDGGGSETNWAAPPQPETSKAPEDVADPLAGIPVGIREFMKTEKRLKAKQKAAGKHIETALDKDLRASVWGHG
ncbi:hypothetical protein CLAFUR4_11570 [Fulvia fulva]|nr:hypothetical protein CLAFUR4_11570 [Fulvia fulva]WPV31836.1 hypothetical protein CLAFUW7_11569 [Fulvia fulva]